MSERLLVPRSRLAETLETLRRAGRRGHEAVVAWLTPAEGRSVAKVYRPLQVGGRAFFSLPPQSLAELLAYLRANGLRVAAQVHSHPEEAFHSVADDHGALIGHLGALSLVVPNFALSTSVETFLEDVCVFELSSRGQWQQVEVSASIGLIDA